MVYFFKLLVFLININQETVLLVMEGLWQRVQDGLTLSDIENIIFFILFIRFLILALRYNIKTSFTITCIGLLAGYLWYRHLIDLISLYQEDLAEIPFLQGLAVDAMELDDLNELLIFSNLHLGDKVQWYNPGKLIYYAVANGIVTLNQETGLSYYIDPISMIVSNLNDSIKLVVLPAYYAIYNEAIPAFLEIVSDYWTQISGLATYTFITRLGRRYCPYLIRWHWTFLLITRLFERGFIDFVDRVYEFQTNILIPQVEVFNYLEKNSKDLENLEKLEKLENLENLESLQYLDQNIILQIDLLTGLLFLLTCFHLGLIFLGLFNAICGQYFYFPFIVENVELHTGPRPKNSIYSGGNTPWQDKKQRNVQRFSGDKNWNIFKPFLKLVAKILNKLRNLF